ncbi:MAG: family 43 glycosylhydrolase, partial [Parasporobacterium sp.]|nr:family 43 glycosylhydrolase [Parasporobacterium sp.]
DYPDVDVIRVGDTYYMISTTMHFFPGGQILESHDLIHWEICTYIYETLEHTPGERLEGEQNIYGHGMWAASLRYHNGKFYAVFIAHEWDKTFLFTSGHIRGPWTKHYIEGIYHDPSLLFDDDGKIYIVYGNRDIRLTELKEDMSGPKPGGIDRIIIRDAPGSFLGYEGSHIYKVNGKYVLFLIHSKQQEWYRIQACFVTDDLTGVWTGSDIMETDLDDLHSGPAQGGIVDTPDGKWFAVVFQDRGAVGRIPVLVPVTWNKDGYPVFGPVTKEISNKSTRSLDLQQHGAVTDDLPAQRENRHIGSRDIFQQHGIQETHGIQPQNGPSRIAPARGGSEPLCACDDFSSASLKKAWQFNHEPHPGFFKTGNGCYQIITDKVSRTLEYARNTLTQRTMLPGCSAEVTVDAGSIKNGDVTGLCLLVSSYAFIGITREEESFFLVMKARNTPGKRPDTAKEDGQLLRETTEGETEFARIPLAETQARLRADVRFTGIMGEVQFSYLKNGSRKPLGCPHKMYFTLEHFTGCRFGLFLYASKMTGGKSSFRDFVYIPGN